VITAIESLEDVLVGKGTTTVVVSFVPIALLMILAERQLKIKTENRTGITIEMMYFMENYL
jgi:hypothetical protein